MRKFAMVGMVAVAAFAFAGCANHHKNDGNMGATNGACSTDGKCCGSCKGDKANMGAVGEKACTKSCGEKSSCSTDKGAMGAVSTEKKSCGSSCGSKSSCTK